MSTQIKVFTLDINANDVISSGLDVSEEVMSAVNSEQFGPVNNFLGWQAVVTAYYANSSGHINNSAVIHFTYKQTT